MAKINYFQLLEIPFDPAEADDRRFKIVFDKAFQTWKQKAQTSANTGSESERATFMEQLSWEQDIQTVMLEKKTRLLEAKSLIEARSATLEQLLDILVMDTDSSPEVSKAQILSVSKKTGLSAATVEKVYVKKGFTVQKPPVALKAKDFFVEQSAFQRIDAQIKQFNKVGVSRYPWADKVATLYDVACYVAGGDASAAAQYYKKRTEDIHSHMELAAAGMAGDMSVEGHLLADLLHAGSAQVFSSENDRKKYDNSLKRANLRSFFDVLKTAPDDFKKDRYFADNCIRKIQKHFPDYTVALGLYNLEAGLVKDPYEPLEAYIHVSCGSCKTPAQFMTRADAEKAKCSTCGAPLYVRCPVKKCGKMVPASADRCECGFHIFEMQFFDEYCTLAERALNAMDFIEAEKYLDKANAAHPDHPKLGTLRGNLQTQKGIYKKPIEELDSLLKANKYEAAQKKAADLARTMPKLNITAQQKMIKDSLSKAAAMMPASINEPNAGNRCVDILRVVSDYSPALDMIRKIPVRPVRDVRSAVSERNGLSCTISWKASEDSGVTYRVVRKLNGIPKQHTDGEVLASEINSLEFCDKTLQSATAYGYAVFAMRYGVPSVAVGCEVVNFSELDPDGVSASAEDSCCKIRWELPSNCLGVRVLRKTGGLPGDASESGVQVMAANASNYFEDRSVQNNVKYGYTLQCIYQSGTQMRYTQGHRLWLSPEPAPVKLSGFGAVVEHDCATITWKNPSNLSQDVKFISCSGRENQIKKGVALPETQIFSSLGNGSVLAQERTDNLRVRFPVAKNSAMTVAIVVVAGSYAMISDTITVSNLEECEIDRSRTRIEGGCILLYLKKIPPATQYLHYFVKTKTGNTAPWMKPEDIGSSGGMRMSLADYNKEALIYIRNIPEEELYISVIAECAQGNGRTMYSSTARLRLSNAPKPVITYSLSWEKTFFGGKTGVCNLTIKTDAQDVPAFKLAYLTSGHTPTRLGDKDVMIAHAIPAAENGYDGGKYQAKIDLRHVPKGTSLRLMASEMDSNRIVLQHPLGAESKVP